MSRSLMFWLLTILPAGPRESVQVLLSHIPTLLGSFTANLLPGAPVCLSRQRLMSGLACGLNHQNHLSKVESMHLLALVTGWETSV